MSEDVEVSGLASDQAAKRNDRVETARPREEGDRRWELEGAGDFELLNARAFGERGLDRALGQRPGDLLVPARANDGDPSTLALVLHPSRSLPTGRHVPQSSPRMQTTAVSA